MTITYTWKVTSVKVKDADSLKNAIVQTYWEKIGVDEAGNTGTFNGATPFTPDLEKADSFVPYEQLTEENVLDWIKSVVTGEYEQHVNRQIQKQIDQKVNQVKEADMPWANK